MSNIVLLDIDHTISNAFWRDEMIGGPWDDYHTAGKEDKPITEIVKMINALRHDHQIICLTARPEKWRQLTMAWLIKHDVMFHELLMRPDDDYDNAPKLKVKLAKQRLGEGFPNDIAFIMDDRDDVAAAFRAEGVTVLQVHAARRIAA